MYVIFPAEEVVDLTLGIVTEPRHHGLLCPHHRSLLTDPGTESTGPGHKQQQLPPPPQPKEQRPKNKTQQTKKEKRKTKRHKDSIAMAGGGEASLRELTHPALNEALKAHNAVSFKLVRTVSDFTQQLSQVYEQHAEELQLLVSSFRKRNAELRKERPACHSSLFQTWETLLQEVEVDSQAHADIASILGRQVARPLLERTFHRKIQSRKVFTHRESFEVILAKAEDKLAKCRQDYKNAYLSYMSNPTNAAMAAYLDCHNSYVQQLHATNGMLDQYHTETLPQLLQELEDVYSDLCTTLADSVLQGAEIISSRAEEQSRRYEGVSGQCRAVSARQDVASLVHSLASPQQHSQRHAHTHAFASPQPPPTPQPDNPDGTPNDGPPTPEQTPPPLLKNEIIVDRLASVSVRTRLDALRKEAMDLEQQMKQNQDALDTLLRIQQRSLESSLFNKANELQEDISLKRFDLRVAQIHLGAVKAQKELFASKAESASDGMRERKMSSSSTGSMKNKWLKAFKSLKASNTSDGALKETEKKEAAAGPDSGSHSLQEYTYRKITPCDVCSQVLRGHTRQGLKCKVCKVNVHADCQERLGRCQPKSRLLRRQKSTSEIETRHADLVAGSPLPLPHDQTPHSPRRQKLNLRMKSLSLDSPESTEHVQKRRHAAAQSACLDPQTSHSSSSRIESPSSPVHNRRLLSARNMRMSSVELPDENEKSLSSASTSPCPSPKSHRLLPTNLYVVLYNFKSRHPDELDLKAGYKVTVIDASDKDWWKGKCFGRVGYFPSKYVIKLQPGEKALQVTHNLQVSDGNNGLMLLRDQIVIQVGEELDGMVMIRNGENQQGVCPLKFLQEV
ncbi:uncharacterized protein LOC126297890 isoform X5 [Schistocerca gregaria]|uniref:uncharacterized protein LOC126297890 isoform X5 n=1 Tax=Schistocerca gregaria TaxID=7010 RepID=UPI00211DAA22|nr:uncharacterized protein LOC126297890 isoform X5 [Schistocerca gregaria]